MLSMQWMVGAEWLTLSWGHSGAVMLGKILYTMQAFWMPHRHSPYQVPTPTLPSTNTHLTKYQHPPYQVPTPNDVPQWPCSCTFTTPTDPNTTQAQQASHAAWNATIMHPCLLCHIIAKTGMTDQTWAQMRDHGGGQRGTEGIGSVGGARGSRVGDQTWWTKGRHLPCVASPPGTTVWSRTHSLNYAPMPPIIPSSSSHRRALQEGLWVRSVRSSGCGGKCILCWSEESLWDLMRRPNAVCVLYNPRWGAHPQAYSHSLRHMLIPGGKYTSPQHHYSLAGIPHPTWGHATQAFWPLTAPSTLALCTVPGTPKPSTSRSRGWWEHCPPQTFQCTSRHPNATRAYAVWLRRTTQPPPPDRNTPPMPPACDMSPLPSARNMHNLRMPGTTSLCSLTNRGMMVPRRHTKETRRWKDLFFISLILVFKRVLQLMTTQVGFWPVLTSHNCPNDRWQPVRYGLVAGFSTSARRPTGWGSGCAQMGLKTGLDWTQNI
jgi:hypothetical protein